MYSKILGSLIMLWGAGALLSIFETIVTRNRNIASMLLICAVKFIVVLIPFIIGYKIFRKKEYSKSKYILGIVIILSVNIGFFFLYKDKINQKIIFFKYSVPVKVKHGTTPKIIKATIEDDIKEIKRQIVNGANVNELDSSGRSAIFYAHNLKILKLLLDSGADVNIVSKNGNTLLNSKAGSTNIQSYEATKLLLEHGLTTETINSQKGVWKYSALHRSDICFFCDNIKDYKDGPKNIELLIKNGANVNAVDKKGETPIFTVNDTCKRLLINNRADIHIINNKKENILFYVKDYTLFKDLVSDGLDYTLINSENETILHRTFSEKVVEFVANEVDINKKNNEGKTALFSCYYLPKKFKALLRKHADVNIINNNGETVLHQYVKECRSNKGEYNQNLLKIVEMILETNIDVNHIDNRGKTALDYARFDDLKNILINKGAMPASSLK